VLSELDGPGAFADALSFSNDGQSIFVLDSSVAGHYGQTSNIWQIDLTGNALGQFEVGLDGEGLTVLADGTLVASVAAVAEVPMSWPWWTQLPKILPRNSMSATPYLA
jgi:hypothetical protein